VPQVAQALAARGWDWEMIVVDDNSRDGTPAVLADLARQFPQLRYLIRTTDRGLSSAVLAGMDLARHEFLVVMDADLSHPPESVPALVDALVRGDGDFVIGSRYVAGGATEDWGFLRWLNSAGATLLARPLAGAVKDPMAGFFGLRRSLVEKADSLNPIGYKIGLELIAKTGATRVAEVPIVFRNRQHGESKLTAREQFRYLEHLSRLYDYAYPKAAPRLKFLIAAGCGAAACVGVVAGVLALAESFAWAMAAGLLAMIGVTLAFYVRYVRTQRAFLVMRRPYLEFAGISAAEFIFGWGFAMATQADSVWFRVAIGMAALLAVRYTLRKVFLHDLRGIRGRPNPTAGRRIAFPPLNTEPARGV
jgi:dolichol-phosphate mannosyltransferase